MDPKKRYPQFSETPIFLYLRGIGLSGSPELGLNCPKPIS